MNKEWTIIENAPEPGVKVVFWTDADQYYLGEVASDGEIKLDTAPLKKALGEVKFWASILTPPDKEDILYAQDLWALDLYIRHWQNEEAPNHPRDYRYNRQATLARLKENTEIEVLLLEKGYEQPGDIVYDNEACPLGVTWMSDKFDLTIEFENWYEDNG